MEETNLLDVEIVTPQKTLYEGSAMSVTIPGSKGPFQILNNHAPIVSTLDVGLTRIVDKAEKPLLYATGAGFTEVHRNKISILVENAFEAEKINIDETKDELAKLKEALKESKEDIEIKTAILEAENKIKAAEKIKS
ncbi:ATP synthase F1 subunit epsilon [Bacteroidota bacterium]